MTMQNSMIRVCSMWFKVDGKEFGTPKPGSSGSEQSEREPEKIGEELFLSLEMPRMTGDESLSDKISMKSIDIRWNRKLRGENYWKIFARTRKPHLEIFLHLPRELLTQLGSILPTPVLHLEGTLEVGPTYKSKELWPYRMEVVELNTTYDLLGGAGENGPPPPWKLGYIPSHWFQREGHNRELRMRYEIYVDWREPEGNSSTLKIGDPEVVSELIGETKPDIALVVRKKKKVPCHWAVLQISTRTLPGILLPTDDNIPWQEDDRLSFPELEVETAQQILDLLYGRDVPIDALKCEVAFKLFEVAYESGRIKLEARMAILMREKGPEWFSPDVVLELYFRVLWRYDMHVHKGLMEHILRVLSKMPVGKVRKSKGWRKLEDKKKREIKNKIRKIKLKEKEGSKTLPDLV